MRIVVTGGAGFVGSWLVDSLLQQGHEVTVVDDLSAGDVANLPDACRFPGPLDILADIAAVEQLVASSDRVYHLAAVVGVNNVVQHPERAWMVTTLGTRNVCEMTRRHRRPLLFVSSSEVYGDLDHAAREADATGLTSAGTLNGAAKWEAERIALESHASGESPTTVVRLFNVTGARQTWRYGMVLPTFAKQALVGEDITVFGSGDQCRSFIDVRDVVGKLIAVMESVNAKGKIINMGSLICTSMNELASIVRNAARSGSRIIHVPYNRTPRAGYKDVRRRIPDLTLAREMIDCASRYNLAATVDSVVEYVASCVVTRQKSD